MYRKGKSKQNHIRNNETISYIYLAWKPCIPYSKKKTAYHLEHVATGGSTWRLHIPFSVGRQGTVYYAVLCDFLCGRSAGNVYVI